MTDTEHFEEIRQRGHMKKTSGIMSSYMMNLLACLWASGLENRFENLGFLKI